MKTLVHDVHTNRPKAKITLTTVLPRIENKHKPDIPQTHRLLAHSQRSAKLNDFLMYLGHNTGNVDIIHHAKIHHDPLGHLAKDGLHPNFRGVRLISENIKHRLRNTFKVTLPTSRINLPSPASTEQQNQPNTPNGSEMPCPPKNSTCDASTQTVDVAATPAVQHVSEQQPDPPKTTRSWFTQTPTRSITQTGTQTGIDVDLTPSSPPKLLTPSKKVSPRRSARNKHK